MALYNHVTRDVNAKIVYFGPGRGGKESSLTHIYRNLDPAFRSSLKAMTVQGNRMLFFDFQPPDGLAADYRVRFHLYTIVDEVLDPSTWRKVLTGVDGIVFVADSAPDRLQENLDRLHELQVFLAAGGSDVDQIPFVMQYNRRDLPEAVALEELQRTLNRCNVPGFPTVATLGEGVQAPLTCLTRMVLVNIRETLVEQGEIVVEEEEEFVSEVEEETASEDTVEPPSPLEEPPRLEEETLADEGAGGAPEIRLEITGGGTLDDGRLTVPVTVTAGGGRREFQLVISLADMASREG